MENYILEKVNIPAKPSAEVQKLALQYLITYPAHAAPMFEGINAEISLNAPYNTIFEAARDIMQSGAIDAERLKIDLFLHLSREQSDTARAASNELAEMLAHPIEGEAMADAARELAEHTKRIRGGQLAQEMRNLFTNPLTTQEQQRAKVEEIYKHINSLSIARVSPVSVFDDEKLDWILTDRNGHGTLATGNIYQIAGLPKSGKSKMVDILTASCLGCMDWGFHTTPEHQNPKILIFDTEMSRADDVRAIRRINKLAGLSNESDHFDKFQYYNITEENEMLSAIIERTQAEKPDLVIIDGINDLLQDPNDLTESKAIIKRLNQFAKTAGGIGKPICIIWLMHLNQSEGATAKKAGGHSGSQSTMKAAGGWIVTRDEDTGIMSAINNFCRHAAVAPIHFKIDEDGETLTNAEIEYNETIATAAEYAEQQAEQRRENAKNKQRERYIKDAYEKCKDLGIWNGEPIDKETFINAYLMSINGHRQNANRDFAKWSNDYGIIETREDGKLYLCDPSMLNPPF